MKERLTVAGSGGPGCYGAVACPKETLLEEILNRLAEYEDAEESGLLLRLPCKPGDAVYYLKHDHITGKKVVAEGVIYAIHIIEDSFFVNITNKDGSLMKSAAVKQFGKTVFTDRKAAAAALEGVE